MYKYRSLNYSDMKGNKYPPNTPNTTNTTSKIYGKFNVVETELIATNPPFARKQEMKTFTTYNKHKPTDELIATNTLMGCFPVDGCEMSNIQRDWIISQKQKKSGVLSLLQSEINFDEKTENLENTV